MRNNKRKNNIPRKVIIGIFAVYICVLLLVVIFKFPTRMILDSYLNWKNGATIERMRPQLIPFANITLYVRSVQAVTDWFFKNLLCNIVIFIPYGLLLPFILEKRKNIFLKTMISGILFIIFIEIFQYISAMGLCDIDDLIMNTISILIGYGLYLVIRKVINKYQKKKEK